MSVSRPTDPEALLRQVLAAYTTRPVDDPAIIEAAGAVADLAAHGWGSVTWEFGDNRLNAVRPAPVYRFGYPRGSRAT